LLYIDSNAFLYPTIYRLETIEEAKDFLLKISEGSVEVCNRNNNVG